MILDLIHESGVTLKKIASTGGGEYASPCPMCGGRDRFRVWPEKGRWMCRQCEPRGGDDVSFLMSWKGVSYPEACRMVGRELQELPEAVTPKAPRRSDDWQPHENLPPHELWRKKAGEFADRCHDALLLNADQLAWLAARGINKKTVKRFKLGWNEKDLYRSRKGWGLETIKKENGKEKKLWLPQGLVIPYTLDGVIHRVRIRQPNQGHKPECKCFKCECRYYVVPGSGMSPMVIPSTNPDCKAEAVTEAELDAMLITQEAGDLVGVIAQGNSSSKPDLAAFAFLKDALHIMNALDYDNAGAHAWPWWQKHFPESERWPVPKGKDPGDYYKDHGGNIRAWIIEGLPIGLKPLDPPPPETTIEDSTAGNDDKDRQASAEMTGPAVAEKDPTSLYRRRTAGNGQEIVVFIDNPTKETADVYFDLVKKGEIIFTPKEIGFVKQAQRDARSLSMDDKAVADLFLELKTLFGPGNKIFAQKDLRGKVLPQRARRPQRRAFSQSRREKSKEI